MRSKGREMSDVGKDSSILARVRKFLLDPFMEPDLDQRATVNPDLMADTVNGINEVLTDVNGNTDFIRRLGGVGLGKIKQ